MSNAEILQKAKRKARDQGWQPAEYTTEWCEYKLLFNHDFAKAFWGEKNHIPDEYTQEYEKCGANSGDFCWQYHLQQMVLEEYPLKYLEKFL